MQQQTKLPVMPFEVMTKVSNTSFCIFLMVYALHSYYWNKNGEHREYRFSLSNFKKPLGIKDYDTVIKCLDELAMSGIISYRFEKNGNFTDYYIKITYQPVQISLFDICKIDNGSTNNTAIPTLACTQPQMTNKPNIDELLKHGINTTDVNTIKSMLNSIYDAAINNGFNSNEKNKRLLDGLLFFNELSTAFRNNGWNSDVINIINQIDTYVTFIANKPKFVQMVNNSANIENDVAGITVDEKEKYLAAISKYTDYFYQPVQTRVNINSNYNSDIDELPF